MPDAAKVFSFSILMVEGMETIYGTYIGTFLRLPEKKWPGMGWRRNNAARPMAGILS